MPFIDSKITVKLSDEKKDTLKSKLGEACSIIGKPETYVMVGFNDEYPLYLGGRKLDLGAYVSVDVFGADNSPACSKMTGKICEIFEQELGIPGSNVYVEYRATNQWGWNGNNF